MGAACGCAAVAPVVTEVGCESHIGPSGVATKQGSSRKPNQDRYVIAPNVGGYEGAHLFCVFDGHGRQGHDVSSFLQHNYPRTLCQNSLFPKNPPKALSNACLSVNQALRNSSHDSEYSGSTGCIALIWQGKLYTANVGDSRAIAGVGSGRSARPVQLTKDQTVGNEKEKSRILAAGGRIKNNRVYCKDRDEPGLIPTRAFGDFSGVEAGVIAAPDVEMRPLDDTFKFLVIMSDGIWENVQASKICQHMEGSESRVSKACSAILDESERTVKSSSSRYPDDMTVVGVHMNNYMAHYESSKRGGTRVGGHSSRKGSNTEVEDEGPELSSTEKIKMTIELCEQMVFQGAHPDDASDAVMGLSDDERLEVNIAMAGIKTVGVETWKDLYATENPGEKQMREKRRLSGVSAIGNSVDATYDDQPIEGTRSRSQSSDAQAARMSTRRQSKDINSMNKRRNSLPPMMKRRTPGTQSVTRSRRGSEKGAGMARA